MRTNSNLAGRGTIRVAFKQRPRALVFRSGVVCCAAIGLLAGHAVGVGDEASVAQSRSQGSAAASVVSGASTPVSPPKSESEHVERAERLREELRAMIASARDRVFPALVNINVVSVNFWNGKEQKGQNVGSGTIVSADGHVITNAHVTDRGEKFRVTLADRQEVPATLVGEDPLTDLAVLKIDVSALKNSKDLHVASLADSDTISVGDTVLAMGSPFALSRSVTLGIVSNTERVFATTFAGDDSIDEMQEEVGERTGLFTRWIQHDAAINPGNSGGPLVNLRGEVVGVNTRGGSNMGFASPSNLARNVMEQIIAHGEVPRSWIGITLKPIERTNYSEGVLVTSVVADSPAGRAGVKAGDLVLSIDGTPRTIRFAEEVPPLLKTLADKPVGSKVTLRVRRGAEETDLALETEKFLRDRGDETALRSWGIAVAQITPKVARDWRLESTEGALVGSIRSGGPAALADPALQPGDVIVQIDGKPVQDLKSIVEMYKEIMQREPLPEFVLLDFTRQRERQITLIKPKPAEREEPPREVPKAWLGVAAQPVARDLAKKLGHPRQFGYRLTRVYPGTEADKAGLKVGDVVFAIDGKNVLPRNAQDTGQLQRRIRELAIDTKAKLSLLREGQPAEVEVVLERSRIGQAEARRKENKDFDLVVREITFFDRDAEQWGEDVTGVVIDQADQGGWAGLAGLGTGDLIQQIQRETVTDLASFEAAMERVGKEQPERVEFVILRNGRTFFKFAEPSWKPTTREDEQKAEQEKAAQNSGKK
ncbi:MAG: PDZ domain-containing protein [Planctomycetota bacterium]|nr:PDZ domain-containing protein [Planctomycetota bacterium]